jgi:hypothetical protein
MGRKPDESCSIEIGPPIPPAGCKRRRVAAVRVFHALRQSGRPELRDS